MSLLGLGRRPSARLVPFDDIPVAILPRSPANVARARGRRILGEPVMTVSATGSLLAPCPIPPVHVPILVVDPPAAQPVRCLLPDESPRTLPCLTMIVVHFNGIWTKVPASVLTRRSYSPVVCRPASVKSPGLRIAVIAWIIWNVAAVVPCPAAVVGYAQSVPGGCGGVIGGLGNLAFLQVRDLGRVCAVALQAGLRTRCGASLGCPFRVQVLPVGHRCGRWCTAD